MPINEQKRLKLSDLPINVVAVFDKRLAARMMRRGEKCIDTNVLINDKPAFLFESEPIFLW